MSFALHAYTYFTTRINGELIEFGSLSEPNVVNLDGNVKKMHKTVGTTTTVKLFDTSLDLATFNFALVACDFDVYLEQVVDDDSSVGDEFLQQCLRGSGRAGVFGIPFIIPKQAAYAGATKNFGGGTLNLIDILRVRNISATQSAEVMCLVFK